MNTLINKSYKDYPSLSRYAKFPYYFNTEDGKYMYGLTGHLVNSGIPYVKHTLTQYDTPDSLALNYYGRPDYFWIILDFNRINDPFIKLSDYYDYIYIPSISDIYFGDN